MTIGDAAQSGPTYRELRGELLARLRMGETISDEHSLHTLAIEEAFELMNLAVLGRGLEEEPQTAAMMMSLAAGARSWAPWMGGGAECAWLHVSKHDENTVGADFALVLATDAGYRIYVGQAKRITNKLELTVDIKQPDSFGTGTTNAHDVLRESLFLKPDAQGVNGTQFQLAKLLRLKKKLANPAVEFIYVLWPDAGGEPLYRRLEDIRGELTADRESTDTSAISQIIKVDPDATLRSLLLGLDCDATKGGLLDFPAAQAALTTITEACRSTAVLDVGTLRFGPNLAAAVGMTGPAALAPAARRTKGLEPGG